MNPFEEYATFYPGSAPTLNDLVRRRPVVVNSFTAWKDFPPGTFIAYDGESGYNIFTIDDDNQAEQELLYLEMFL